jgi:PUA domain protein
MYILNLRITLTHTHNRFTQKENVASSTQLKQSIQRDIRKAILTQFPMMESYADDLLPKKTPMFLAKCHNYINIYMIDDVPLFFTIFEGKDHNPFFPTLKVLHKCMLLHVY